jgi:acetate kinase
VKLALEIFIYRIKKYIGAYTGVMAGVDAVIFTGGIGENQPGLVKEICKDAVASNVKVLVVPTDEELMIARDTFVIASPDLPRAKSRACRGTKSRGVAKQSQ